MYPAPSWRLNDILNINQKYNLGLEVGVAPLPQVSSGNEIYYPNYWAQSVSKACQHPNEAWTFIKYLAQAQELTKLNDSVKTNGRSVGILYPRLSMTDANLKDTNLNAYTLSLAKAKNWAMYDGWNMQIAFNSIFSNDATSAFDVDALQGAISSVVK